MGNRGRRNEARRDKNWVKPVTRRTKLDGMKRSRNRVGTTKRFCLWSSKGVSTFAELEFVARTIEEIRTELARLIEQRTKNSHRTYRVTFDDVGGEYVSKADEPQAAHIGIRTFDPFGYDRESIETTTT